MTQAIIRTELQYFLMRACVAPEAPPPLRRTINGPLRFVFEEPWCGVYITLVALQVTLNLCVQLDNKSQTLKF